MIVLLLLLGVSAAVAWDPDCYLCEYERGIGYVKSDEFCGVYYVCYRNTYGSHGAYEYKWHAMCCPEYMTWDEEHLTCVRDHECYDSREKCPTESTTIYYPCPEHEVEGEPTQFRNWNTWEVRECPYGQIWSQDDCSCVRAPGAPWKPPCTKLLHFDFNGDYDSHSCYNFAKGDPYGKPSLGWDTLGLNGKNQFLSIPYLNNWWAWNPAAKTFTLCIWIYPYYYNSTAGIVATNCEFQDPQTGAYGSVVDICLEDGELVLNLGTLQVYTYMWPPVDDWTKICVTFDNGHYSIYWNGLLHKEMWLPITFPFNSHSAVTLGYKNGFPTFGGYMDDFCFWTEVLSAAEIEDCYKKGPSIHTSDDDDDAEAKDEAGADDGAGGSAGEGEDPFPPVMEGDRTQSAP